MRGPAREEADHGHTAHPPPSTTHRGLKLHQPRVRLCHLTPVALGVRVLVEHVYRMEHLLQRRLLLHFTRVPATRCSSVRGARSYRWPGLAAMFFSRSLSPLAGRAHVLGHVIPSPVEAEMAKRNSSGSDRVDESIKVCHEQEGREGRERVDGCLVPVLLCDLLQNVTGRRLCLVRHVTSDDVFCSA